MLMSIRGYATHRHCTPKSVRRALESGRIRAEPDGKIESDAADAAWQDNTDPARGGNVLLRDKSFLEARIRHEHAKAALTELKLKKQRGELVNRQGAIDLVFRLARQERDSWLRWPAQFSATLAAELAVDPGILEIRLLEAVNQHLRQMVEFRFDPR